MCMHECMVGCVSLSLGINQSRAQTPFGKLDFSERGLGTRLWLYMCIVRVSTGQPRSQPSTTATITTSMSSVHYVYWKCQQKWDNVACCTTISFVGQFQSGIIPLRYYMFTTNLRSHYVCVYVNSSNEPRPSLLGNERIRNSTLTLAHTHKNNDRFLFNTRSLILVHAVSLPTCFRRH